MSAISQKSITGITSITTPAGVDNQLTLHNNNTSEAVKIDVAGNVHINNQLRVTGFSTFTNELQITPSNSSSYSTHLNYNNTGTNYISHANGGATSFRNSSGGGTAMIIQGSNKAVDIDGLLRHLDDTDTFMEFGDNTISFDTAGSERFRIDSSGRVLIGTTTEGFAEADDLTINSADHGGITIRTPTNKEGNIAFSDTTSGTGEYSGLIRYRHSNDDLGLWTGSNLRLLIDSSGRVLIGGASNSASSHADELQIINTSAQGGLSIINASNGQGNIYFGHSGGTADGRIEYSHAADYMRLFTANTERFRITSDGKFGLNKSDPDNDLVIKSTAAHTVMQVRSGSESTKFTIQTVQDSDVRIGTVSDHPLNIYTNSLSRVHIHEDGWFMLNSTTLGTSKTAKELIVQYNNDGVSGGDQGRAGITIRSGQNSSNVSQPGYIYFSDGTSGSNESIGGIKYDHNDDKMNFTTGGYERLRIQSNGNVGIARTTNNAQTSSTNSLYNLSINRESSANTYDGLNKSLNVDNQYTVQTFRAINTNRSSTTGWMDVAHFRAWDINARVIIQAGGTFTGDQINIDVQSSYNSALSNGRAGPVLEVKRTEGHSGGRFTKVKIGCHNSNRNPILQVYFDGSKTHNSAGSVSVTVHDYGSNYGHGTHRGEAKFATATTLNETWEELDIDESGCDYFNTSTTPAFSAYRDNPASQIAAGVYTFDDQILDRGGNNYNTGNGRFTAPCDGVYYFIATLQMYGDNGAGTHARFQKNGVDIYNNGTNTPTYDERAGSHHSLTMFALVQLSTDDYVECVRSNTTRGMQSAIAGFLVR